MKQNLKQQHYESKKIAFCCSVKGNSLKYIARESPNNELLFKKKKKNRQPLHWEGRRAVWLVHMCFFFHLKK